MPARKHTQLEGRTWEVPVGWRGGWHFGKRPTLQLKPLALCGRAGLQHSPPPTRVAEPVDRLTDLSPRSTVVLTLCCLVLLIVGVEDRTTDRLAWRLRRGRPGVAGRGSFHGWC